MPSKEEEEAANWTKAISGLTITKCGLIISIKRTLKNFLFRFSPEQLDHLSEFVFNTKYDNVEFITKKGEKKGSWKIASGWCKSGQCQTILDLLWEQHENKSKNIVWSPNDVPSTLYVLNQTKTTSPFTNFFDDKCYICGEFICVRDHSQIDSLIGKRDVDTYYWQIANMYMFRGKERNHFPNTGPEDTDVALIFKLMKNCKLFSLDEDNDTDNLIYEDLLEVRNMLMHSADNRLSDEVLEECFKRMKSILQASIFSNEYSRKAISGLEKLKDMRIIMTSLTSKQLAIVQDSFNVQQSSLKYDINVTGSLKHDYVLEGFLKASTDKCKMFTENAKQTPAPSSQTSEPPSKANVTTLGGAATGAAVGSIAGPPGAAIGAAVGWLFGKLAE